jgi:hypothetical protein
MTSLPLVSPTLCHREILCRALAVAVSMALPVSWVSDAQASGSPVGSGYGDAVWMPVGANIGAASHLGRGTGLLLGGEVSFVDLRSLDDFNLVPQGGFIDFLHDSQSETWRLSFGPELVACPFVGFDAGLVVELGPRATELGARLRYFMAFVLVTPYVGSTVMFSGQPAIVEAGVLVKIPLSIYD